MTELRKSCNFCRQRRMKCNGDLPWCAACNERGFPCVYESIGARGRPRRKDGTDDKGLINARQIGSSRPMSAIGETFINSSQQGFYQDGKTGDANSTTRLVLEEFASIENHIDQSQPPLDKLLSPFTLGNADSEQSLMIVLEQLISLSTGDNVVDSSTSLHTLYMDRVNILKTEPPNVSMDQPILSSAQLMQLIDLAFIHHPFLPLIVSKTSLLYDHRDGLAHPALLFTIAAEGLQLGVPSSEAIFEAGALPSLNVLIDQSEYELKRSIFDLSDAPLTISLCQILLLMAYRMLVSSQIRRATVYLSLCCRALDIIQERNEQGNPTEVKMNGVLIATVEEEMFHHLHWLTSSFSMWIKLQYPSLGAILGLHYRLDATCLPSVMPRQSALYQLDLMSRNLSVLRSHEKTSIHLYCLAHIYNMIDHYMSVATPSVFNVNLNVANLDRDMGKVITTASRLLGIKTCLVGRANAQTVLNPSNIQAILSFGNAVLEASSSVAPSSAQPAYASKTILQSTMVRLHVEAIEEIVTYYEILFAFCLPSPYRARSDILQRYCTASDSEAELIDANKWHMVNTLQSLELMLGNEALSCPQRSTVLRKLTQLLVAITVVLPVVEMDRLSTSNTTTTTTTGSDTTLFSSPADNQNTLQQQQMMPFSAGPTNEPHDWEQQGNHPSNYYGSGFIDNNASSPQYYSLGMNDWDENKANLSNNTMGKEGEKDLQHFDFLSSGLREASAATQELLNNSPYHGNNNTNADSLAGSKRRQLNDNTYSRVAGGTASQQLSQRRPSESRLVSLHSASFQQHNKSLSAAQITLPYNMSPPSPAFKYEQYPM